jgi:hypothetical protein
MITGWRHNDQNKSERVFRDEVQKEFERLYNLDGRGDAFDKAVKDAINRLLDPNNGNGFGRDGISGVNGLDGQGSGRDGAGSGGGKNGGDGKNGSGSNGSGGGGGNGNGSGNFPREQLTQFNVLDFERKGAIKERTSPFSTLAPTPDTAGGSGLVWIGGTSAGHYAPDQANKLAHAITSQWYRFPEKPLNETRLFATSFEWAKWTTPDNIVAEFPNAIDIDGTLKFPYAITDVGFDSFGHGQKVKITNLQHEITKPPGILEHLRLYNTGVAWYDDTNGNILFPNENSEAYYNGSVRRIIGHGDTSNWTVRRPDQLEPGATNYIPYNPSKGNYLPDHHSFVGDWDNPTPTRINPDQINTYGPIAPYSVVVDLNADDWGHAQFLMWRQMQKLYAGKGLWYNDGQFIGSQYNWYLPAKERRIDHPPTQAGFEIQPPFPDAGVIPSAFTDVFGNNLLRWAGGFTTVNIDNVTYIAPRVVSGFWTNSSGHIEAVRFSELPPIRGQKGDKGDAAIINASVLATNTLPAGSAASVQLTQPPTSTPSNRFFEFTFNIPRGEDGDDGDDGLTPNVNGFVLSTTTLPANQPATVSVANYGTALNPNFGFTFGIPAGPPGTGTGDTNIFNTYNTYNAALYNTDNGYIGSGGLLQPVWNPGATGPFYIRELTADLPISLAVPFGRRMLISHNVQPLLITGSGLWENPFVGGWDGAKHEPAIRPSSFYDSSFEEGWWRFPVYPVTEHGHVQDILFQDVFLGGGGVGGGGGSYNWRVGVQTGSENVPSGNTVRFLSEDEDKLSIVQNGLDITFSLEEALKPLIMGNGLSQDPNSAASAGLQYDPYTGLTIHVNNNTKDLAGIVRKGSDASVLAQTTKVWGTDTGNNPNWRPTEEVEGDNVYIVVEPHPTKPNTKVIRFLGI